MIKRAVVETVIMAGDVGAGVPAGARLERRVRCAPVRPIAQRPPAPAAQAGAGAQQPVAGRRRSQERRLPDLPQARFGLDAQGRRAGGLHRLPRRRCRGGARALDRAGTPQLRRDPGRGRTSNRALDIWRTSANPGERVVSRARRARRVHPLRQSRAICASPIRPAARATPKKSATSSKSMMRHGGMLWGAALYNNGSYPIKDTQFGEVYTADGKPAIVNTVPRADAADDRAAGHPAVPAAAVPVPGDAAGQRPARLRARRPAPARGRQSRS